MPQLYIHFAYPVLIIVLALFCIYRLKIAQTKNAGGVGLIYSGLILTFFVSIIFLVEQHPDFSDWFLEGIYPIIVILEFALLAAGLILFVAGLAIYFSNWGDRIIEVDIHLNKLKLLEKIQQECRAPYPVPELLNRVLTILLYDLEEKAGAAYLFDQKNRTFTLAAVAGMAEEEIELLKDYQYGRNVISEAIDNDTPLITSDFRSFGGRAQLALAGFNSLLILPLISGKTKLGALLFFSEKKSRYSEEFISLVSPIINWLSARIEITQIGRILKKSNVFSETTKLQISDQFNKLKDLTDAVGPGGSVTSFAKKCRVLARADEVWLIGLADGELVFHGSSSEKPDLSDNFRAALVNALSKRKAVVLNQEETDEGGQSYIARSSILYPVGKNDDALLLVKKGGTISITDADHKIFDIAAALAGIVIENAAFKNSAEARRRGFDTINDIFRIKLDPRQSEQDILKLVGKITGLISPDSIALLFRRRENHFEVVHSNVDHDALRNIVVSIGEGGVGKIAALKHPDFESGYGNVSRYLEQYHEENRIQLYKLFGDSRGPVFQGDYPILINNRVDYVISIYDFKPCAVGDTEIHQLFSILTGLFNLRLELARPDKAGEDQLSDTTIKPPSVLIIADQPVILDLMTSMCQSMNCRVRASGNSGEALSIFESEKPDVVIIDILSKDGTQKINISDLAQQGLSARDIASRIKEVSPKTTTIAVAGWGLALDEEKLTESGFDYILQKPFKIEQLYKVIFGSENRGK